MLCRMLFDLTKRKYKWSVLNKIRLFILKLGYRWLVHGYIMSKSLYDLLVDYIQFHDLFDKLGIDYTNDHIEIRKSGIVVRKIIMIWKDLSLTYMVTINQRRGNIEADFIDNKINHRYHAEISSNLKHDETICIEADATTRILIEEDIKSIFRYL